MNTCNINFLNSFNYYQIYAIQYIYTYKIKQIQFDYNTKYTTSITKPTEKKKY